jgi:hypothetical protein
MKERVEKRRVGKDEKERDECKKRASRIAHDLMHLDLERESLRSQPSSNIHTLALLIIVCMLFSSIDPCFDFTI